MMTLEALEWLKSVEYGKADHEERMELIKIAKTLFPSEEEEDSLRFEQE